MPLSDLRKPEHHTSRLVALVGAAILLLAVVAIVTDSGARPVYLAVWEVALPVGLAILLASASGIAYQSLPRHVRTHTHGRG